MNKLRTTAVLFAASATLVAGMAGTASANTGGNPTSAVPPGCSFFQGVTTCTTTSTSLGTPSSMTAPAGFKSTTGPAYDYEYATNVADCTPGAPIVTGGTVTTTTPSTVTTTTTAHYDPPGSPGLALPTLVSSAPGPTTVTTSTTPQPASPGTVTVAGTDATSVFTGLKANTYYGIGVRCGSVTYFNTDANGAAIGGIDLGSFVGQLIQIEVYPVYSGYTGYTKYFGVDYAVTALFTPTGSSVPQRIF